MNDLKHAFRSLRKHPLANGVIVLTIAMLIASVCVIYASYRDHSARLAPFPDPERVVQLWRMGDRKNSRYFPVSHVEFYTQKLSSFEDLGAIEVAQMVTLTGVGESVSYAATPVSPSLLRLAGLSPVIGRLFDASDEERGDENIIIISEQLWRDKLDADQQVIGRELQLNDEIFTVVGVLPEAMQQTHFVSYSDIWKPIYLDRLPQSRSFLLFGRLMANAGIEQAQVELDAVAPPLEDELRPATPPQALNPATGKMERHPSDVRYQGARVTALGEALDRSSRGSRADMVFAWIFGTVLIGSVIGIACFNVANLLLARVSARSRELATRVAIGASRWRIMREILSETILLSTLGGLLGLVVSFWLVDLFQLQRVDIRLDWGLYLMTASGAVGLGILAGLLPALRSANMELTEALKDGGHTIGGRRRHRLRNFLVTSQIAMALILCVLAGVMIRNYVDLVGGDLGFDPDKVVSVNVSLRNNAYQTPTDKVAYMDRGLRAIQETPGVETAAVTLGFGNIDEVLDVQMTIEAATDAEEQNVEVGLLFGSEGYRECLGSTLLRGRDLASGDAWSTQEALVNEAFVAKCFPNTDPLGKRFKYDAANHWLTIVGVTANRHPLTTRGEVRPEALLSHRLSHWNRRSQSSVMFLARTQADAKTMAEPVREALIGLDAVQPVRSAVFYSEFIERRAAPARFAMRLLVTLAGIGLFVALMGVYGVVAFTVTERTREIGIRMAVGATRRDASGLMLWQGGRLILLGAVPGTLIGALALIAVQRDGMGAQYSPFDPTTYLATLLVVGTAGTAACLLAARKAANLNPMQALHHE